MNKHRKENPKNYNPGRPYAGNPTYRVYRTGEHPNPKKHFYFAFFGKRSQARSYCRNRCLEAGGIVLEGLTIVDPRGNEEPYAPSKQGSAL